MITRKQADKIINLQNECILAIIEEFNIHKNHEEYEKALLKKTKTKSKFKKYVESLVKENIDWTTIPLPEKKRG